MKSKKILILIVIALIVVLFASIMIIKLKQTNKIDMVSEKEIVNEINNTEEEITEENIVVESKNIKYIYFIAETKGSMQSAQLKGAEKGKIECAKKHFESISNGNVKYGVVDSYEHLIDLVTGINKI